MARTFNGSTAKIVSGTAPGFSDTTPFSLSIWAYGTANAANGHMLGNFNDASGFGGLALYWGSSGGGSNHASIFLGDADLSLSAKYDNAAQSLNTWYHLVYTYTGSANIANLKLYKNGVQATTSDNATNPSGFTNVALQIGTDVGSVDWFTGRLADAAVWNVALTQGEITGLSKGARPYRVRRSGLVRWWPLDGLISPEPDLSGNKDNGTVTAATLGAGPPIMPFTPRWGRFLDPVAAAAATGNRLRMMVGAGV